MIRALLSMSLMDPSHQSAVTVYNSKVYSALKEFEPVARKFRALDGNEGNLCQGNRCRQREGKKIAP